MAQKLSKRAKAAKLKRDKKYAMTANRRRKKAETSEKGVRLRKRVQI